MAAPIILWNPRSDLASDDAGNGVIKTTLAPPRRPTPQYTAYDPEEPKRFSRVPRLASFCIRTLSKYPEQLHQLGSMRLFFDAEKGGTDDSVLRAVLPKWKTADFSLLNVDPGVWAAIIQIYGNAPEVLRVYPCQLSDPHVPLLNQIPVSPDFTLLTVLDLEGSEQVTDDNILSFKVLHNLAALDLSRCLSISAQGIVALSRTLMFNEMGEKRGPWALRILRLRRCLFVDKTIFNCLVRFPLLSVVDLRETKCKFEDVRGSFYLAGYNEVFDIPLGDAIQLLSAEHEGVYPNESPFILSLEDTALAPEPKELLHAYSRHESFVVLPPSRGSTVPGCLQMQFGNLLTDEFRQKRAAREERMARRWNRMDATDSGDEDICYDWGNSYDGWPSEEGSDIDEDSNGNSDIDEDSNDDSNIDEDSNSDSNIDEDNNNDSGLDEDRNDDSGPDEDSNDDSDLDETSVEAPDNQLLMALQESMRMVGGGTVIVPIEESSNGTHTSRASDTLTSAASTETFYRQRPHWFPRKQSRSLDGSSYDLALVRVPPSWKTLDAFTQVPQVRTNSVKAPKIIMKTKKEASMQALHVQLFKRRRLASTVNRTDDTATNKGGLSPLPSPTSTVCDAKDMSNDQRRTLHSISNLRIPPRPSFPAPPRLKLDPAIKSVERSSSNPPRRFSGVVPRCGPKVHETSLIEGFKRQASKPPAPRSTSAAIKAPRSGTSGRETNSSRKQSANTSKLRSKGRNSKITIAAEAGGFDWKTWCKG